jgi:acyl-CoA synthetase (AMP-forming)/AMP-acid ligase II
MTPSTLIEYLVHHGETRADGLYARYLFSDRTPVEVTFGQNLARTRRFAAGYSAHGIRKGDIVLVILEHHEDLMPAYLGATWLGAIPAFLPHPNLKTNLERYYLNLETLTASSVVAAILARPAVREMLARKLPEGSRPALLDVDEVTSHGLSPAPSPHSPEDVALIQYSSGSTGLQKGAVLSHRAILAEIAGVGEFFDIGQDDRLLTWVPLYHDWGLVCVALHALADGIEYTLLSPIDWVRDPVIAWRAVNDHRCTVFYQPNFAFNLMTRRIKDGDMDGVDLSSLRLVLNGAEPCFWESHEMLANRFSRWGLSRDSLGIVYGMAEVTNSVFGAGHREPIVVDGVDRFVLQREERAEPVSVDSPNLQRFLGVGRALRGTEFKVVDDDRNEVEERRIGEVAIRSEARMHGYHRNEEATAASLAPDGWYYSGDMGYRVGDILFITGRKSDVIIIGGVNIYPQDVEKIVAEHPASVPGRVAAIGVDDAEIGTQKMVLIVESKSTEPDVLAELAQYARTEISQRLNVVVSRVVHVPHMWLIKTSSGKIARIPNYQRLQEREKEGS